MRKSEYRIRLRIKQLDHMIETSQHLAEKIVYSHELKALKWVIEE